MAFKKLKSKKKKSGKRRKFSDTGNLLRQGTTALIGIGLLSETASAVNRI